MELNNIKIMESLKNKSVLITGSTGFLAKLFTEKVLRYQPNVKQLYLLVRASNTDMAKQRLENEVVQMDVLKVLREKYEGCFSSYFWSKVTPVVGDIASENFGIKDHNLLQLLLSKVDIIINSAATTNFNERAAMFGWPNTYTFTKAMGEILIYELRGDLPLVILRPTILTSTYKEPFPGWIEGVSTVDLVIVGYGTGQLTSFPGNPNTILDMVPGDMVVNAMFAAIAVHSRQPSLFIYQILWLLGVVLLSDGLKNQYGHLNRKYNHLKAVARAYRPYTLFQRSFDDCNLQKLRVLVEEKDNEAFGFDTKCINWDQYLVDVHIPGLLKYGMAEKMKS